MGHLVPKVVSSLGFEDVGSSLNRHPCVGPQKRTGPKPKEIKVETFRIDYLIRGPKDEKLSLQPIRKW